MSYCFLPYFSRTQRESTATSEETCVRSEIGFILAISFWTSLTLIIIGLCITLHSPDIVLQVLTERPHYRLDLDLNTARDLLHSIFVRATHATPLVQKMAE